MSALIPADEPVVLPAEPQEPVTHGVGQQLGACVAGTQLDQVAVVDGEADLGNLVSPAGAVSLVRSLKVRIGWVIMIVSFLCNAVVNAALHPANIEP